MAGAVMTGELVGLLHRAAWARLSMSAGVSDGSTVLVAPGRRYRYQAGEYVTGCDGGRPWELPGEDVDAEEGSVPWISGPEPPIRELLCPAWLERAPGWRCGGGSARAAGTRWMSWQRDGRASGATPCRLACGPAR